MYKQLAFSLKALFQRIVLVGLICVGCEKSPSNPIPSSCTGEYVFRYSHEPSVFVEEMLPVSKALYPWEEEKISNYPKITKEFFRCKGSSLHPVRLEQKEKEIVRHYDCGGTQKHSLPLREQKEFIYPILIELLNYIQMQTGKRVVITCGHCCPDHNTYLDSSAANRTSKHLLGAEVDFYVQGLEEQPEKIVDLIKNFYQLQPKYKGKKKFEEFKRWDKQTSKNLHMQPYYNEEVFIKIFKKTEGRDFDNRHSYPYISIQVRFDWDLQEKVSYSWQKAFGNFHRW